MTATEAGLAVTTARYNTGIINQCSVEDKLAAPVPRGTATRIAMTRDVVPTETLFW